MAGKVLVIIFALASLSSSSLIQPYDLAAEAEHRLITLLTVMRRRISLADDDIQDLYNSFRSYARDEINTARISIQQEHETINSQISQVKNLAQAAGKDVSTCMNGPEDQVLELSDSHIDKMSICNGTVVAEAEQVTKDAKYFVDIIINKVHSLEFQFKSCNGDLLCISPIYTQTQLYEVSLVQDIRTEIAAVDDLLAKLKLSAETCAEQNVAAYVAEANILLNQIISCVDAILG